MNQPAAPASGTPATPPAGGAPPAGTPPATPPTGTPPAGETTFTAPWAGVQGVYKIGEGDKAQPWWSGIQEEPIRAYMQEKNYANPDEAARAAWNANKINKITPDLEAFVQNKATPEQEASVYKMLGRPETADAYEFKNPNNVPLDPKMVEFGKNFFHKLGLPPARAQAAFDMWNEFAGQYNDQVRTAGDADAAARNATEMTALQTKWGAELETNRLAGHRAVQSLGLPNDLIQNVEKHIGSAAVVELLAAIGKKTGEGGFKGAGTGGTDPNDPSTMSPDAAKARIAALNIDPAFTKRYNDKSDPGHKDALLLMERLYAKAG